MDLLVVGVSGNAPPLILNFVVTFYDFLLYIMFMEMGSLNF